MSSDSSRLRLAVLGVVVVSLFSALFARLWYLQVLDSETFVAAATSNQVRLVYTDAPRGRILDRQGRVLVDNRRSQAITVNRNQLSKLGADAEEVKGRLAALLNLSREDLDRRIADVRYSQYKPIPVAEDVPEEVYAYVKEHQGDFPGVEATILSSRSYPNGPLAAHVLGYVGEINDRELDERRQHGYRLGESIGKSGAELVYEDALRGEPGVTTLQVNARGEVVSQPLSATRPVPGDDVTLTVDLDIQRLAEESLQRGLESARRAVDREHRKHFLAPAGAVVVTDPRDGAVLAMASWPTFNPADFVNGIKRDVFAVLTDPANHYPLNNRAVTGQYAPGSTFKLVTAVAALERGMIAANSSLTDEGSFRVPNCRGERCTFRNAGSRAWGRVDLRRAMTVSSDVYFYNLGARFWIERSRFGNGIQDTARAFGLGEKSGLPLVGDKAGVIPDPERKKRLNAEKPNLFPEGRWFTGDNINMSIGQGDVLVTPVQLANAYATFANGGTLFEPRLGQHEPPVVRRTLGLNPAMRGPVLEGLRGAVTAEDGTATGAFAGFPFDQLSVAGKTGTAQVRGKQDTAVFAAFAPAENPQYAISVFMEEAGFGGSTAAPVARRVLEGIVRPPAEGVALAAGTD